MELFLIMLAWILGIILGLYLKKGIVIFIVLFFILICLRKRNKYIKVLCKKEYLIIFLICLFISFFKILYLENQFSNMYRNVPEAIQVVGTIVSEPIQKKYTTLYTIKIDKINGDKKYKNTNLKLYVKNGKKLKRYEFGDKILLKADFELPEARRNTGGFDYKEKLKIKGIYGIIEAETSNIKVVKKENVNICIKTINFISNKIKNKIDTIIPENEASVLNAILIGNKDDLEETTKEDFKKSNLSHMLAISGAHVSYVIMIIGFVISKSKIGKKSGKILTIIFLIFFMFLTGNSPSVLRACIMSIYVIIASLLHKRVTTTSSINISLLLIILINPYYILDVGLQLSFGGTIGIVLIYKSLEKHITKIKKNKIIIKIVEILGITISANIIIIPIMMYHFNTLSLTFLISNLLASPFMGIIIILGFSTLLISFILPFKILSIPLKIIIKLFLKVVNFSANLPFSEIYVITPRIYEIVIYYLILIMLLIINAIKNKKTKRKIEKKIQKTFILQKIITILLILSLILKFRIIIPQNLKIYFIDVGQGDSTLIQTPNHKNILIDGGGNRDISYNVGKSTLLPYILNRQITKIDYIIFSHFDSDHCQGLIYVMEKLKVKNIIIGKQYEKSDNYEEFKKIAENKKIKVKVVKVGDKIEIEKDLDIFVLWPNDKDLIEENPLNNNSLVCKLIYKNFSMLFTGDIEEIAEKEILRKYNNNLSLLKSTVLKVAHHGSKTSSCIDFLNAVKPKIALIGVRKR